VLRRSRSASTDLTGGVETAVVVANNGNVTLSSATLRALSDGGGDTTTIVVAAVGKIVQRDARWAYTYANATVPPAGTCGGINTNNSRVTYTASVP
jgi:hypothetical protein